jgi:O-antigen/teichoic acid export membrane protein
LNKLRSNIVFNLLGQGWGALIQLIALPLYIKLLGIESYGLIAFYVTLQATIQAFDFGLGQTLNREVARLGANPGQARQIHDTMRTVELAFIGVVAIMGIGLFAFTSILGAHVIKAEGLTALTVTRVLELMVVLLPIQWAASIYQGGLVGLERQVLLNILRITFATVNTGVALLLLHFVSSSLEIFFWWQIIASIAYLLAVVAALRRALPKAVDFKPSFRIDILKNLRGFAAGMGAISVAGIVFAYLDRWILISMADLKIFGYYSVAVVVANSLYYIITPIFTAMFPRFTTLIAKGQGAELVALYALGTQFMVALVIPVALAISFFSYEIIKLWTQNPILASEAAPIASILVLGTALNGLMNLPFALQLASGWVRLALSIVIGLIVIFVPLSITLTFLYGGMGCAIAWLSLNMLYFVVGTKLTHQRFSPELMQGWFLRNLLPGIFAAAAVILPVKIIVVGALSTWQEALVIGTTLACAVALACIAASESRRWLFARVASLYNATLNR